MRLVSKVAAENMKPIKFLETATACNDKLHSKTRVNIYFTLVKEVIYKNE